LIFYKAPNSESGSALCLARLVHDGRSFIRCGKRGLPKCQRCYRIISDVANCSYLEDGLSLRLCKKVMVPSLVGSIRLGIFNRHRHAEYLQSRKTV
jgi:hypothetical protein